MEKDKDYKSIISPEEWNYCNYYGRMLYGRDFRSVVPFSFHLGTGGTEYPDITSFSNHLFYGNVNVQSAMTVVGDNLVIFSLQKPAIIHMYYLSAAYKTSGYSTHKIVFNKVFMNAITENAYFFNGYLFKI